MTAHVTALFGATLLAWVAPLATAAQSCALPERCALESPFSSGAADESPAVAVQAAPQFFDDGPSPERAFVYSLTVPGTGQFVMGQRRWMAYLAGEVLGVLWWIDRRRAGSGYREDYRDHVWETARSGASVGPRIDGDFDYYETLTKWRRSGVWDGDPASEGVQPETDPTAFNGSIWSLARGLFSVPDEAPATDPRYQQALSYYMTNAYGSEFLWSWEGLDDDQQELGRLIRKSDDAFQRARLVTGVIVANHVLSAVDAYVSARLRDLSSGRVESAFRLDLFSDQAGVVPRGSWSLSIRTGIR